MDREAVVAQSTTNTTSSDYELFVFQGTHPQRYQWANIFSAMGTFVYSCLPSCIVVETMAALAPSDRKNMLLVVDLSFMAYASKWGCLHTFLSVFIVSSKRAVLKYVLTPYC